MHIANNVLKHNLKNVYFLGGTACGGKTTMGKELSKKYGFIHYDDNYHTDQFMDFKSICDPIYQPASTEKFDWEHYFNRPIAEWDNWLSKSGSEHLEYILMELIKLSQNNRVIADLFLPISFAKEITEYNRLAFLITEPKNVIKDYYQREDHRDIYDLIMTLKDPQKSLDNLYALLEYGTQKFIDELYASNMFYIVRDEKSTVDNTLMLLEKHFGLTHAQDRLHPVG